MRKKKKKKVGYVYISLTIATRGMFDLTVSFFFSSLGIHNYFAGLKFILPMSSQIFWQCLLKIEKPPRYKLCAIGIHIWKLQS